VLFHHENFSGNEIVFDSESGELRVRKDGDTLTLDFPLYKITETEATHDVVDAIGKMPAEAYEFNGDLMLVYHDQLTIEMISPDFRKLIACRYRAVIVTAPGNNSDFVYRFFVPKEGIDEDPATGSAQCALMPYWTKRINKETLSSIQVSKRIGQLTSTLKK
jgi:predicted PhzF superfamily epimerase YddE/YHI9